MRAGDRHFALAADGDYAIPLATAVAGLLGGLRRGAPVHVWIVDLGLSDDARPRLESVARRSGHADVAVHWLAAPATALDALGSTEHFTVATYGRLLLAELLPDEVLTVVSLDSDVVVRGDLSALTELELGEKPVAAVQDFVVETVGAERSAIRGLTGRSPAEPYFNAGVLVLNLPAWRSASLSRRLLEFARDHAPLPYADQDALNAVIDAWHELPPEWNVQSRVFWLDEAPETELILRLRRSREQLLDHAIALHYSGPSKPWEPWNRNPGPELWRRTLMRSGALSLPELCRWGAGYYPRRALACSAISLRRALRRKAAHFRPAR